MSSTPSSRPGEIDAELVAFLHDLPDGATEMIRQLTRSAAEQGAKKSSKGGWVRLGIQSVMLGGVVAGALMKYGNVPTKDDVRALRDTITLALTIRGSSEETQNNRLSANEKSCDAAQQCCARQEQRIDLITSPRRP